jgi:hypothetical protein
MKNSSLKKNSEDSAYYGFRKKKKEKENLP